MSKKNATPYVPAEVRQGRLVRVCPVCNEHIVESTDDDGMVSNQFVEHYETEHPAEPEPEKPRLCLLGAPPPQDGKSGPDVDAINRIAFEHVRKQFPDVEWQLVERFEDLPKDTPAVQAAEVLLGSWTHDDDPSHARQIRWYTRDGDKLVFTPTEKQNAAYDQASRRVMDARFVLLDRHRDELPTFAVDDEIKGTEAALDAFDRFRAEIKPLEDVITKDLDTAQNVARHQFLTGHIEWLATINDAITAAGISEAEIQAKREWFVARQAELERLRR